MDFSLRNKIIRGEIDVNNQELFASTLIRSLLFDLNNSIKLRDKYIPHFILNTGDDIMYLDVKGQDQSKEPLDISNENFVYNSVPRCIVDVSGIEVLEDQLTSPYTRGSFDLEYGDEVRGFNAEFRRVPLKYSVSLKYYLDTFTDSLTVSQKIISDLLFIRTFNFTYMGQTITATYKVPTSFSTDKNITFDGGTTESKLRTVSLDLEVETNMPVFEKRTVVENNMFFKKSVQILSVDKNENIKKIIE